MKNIKNDLKLTWKHELLRPIEHLLKLVNNQLKLVNNQLKLVNNQLKHSILH